MSLGTMELLEDNLFEQLSNETVTTVVLTGKPGTGKTWMARHSSGHPTIEGSFDFILWVFLNKKYDRTTLYRSIARQLFLFSATEELEVDDNVDIEEVQEEENLNLGALDQKISEALGTKGYLLILDDEGNKMEKDEVMDLLPDPLKHPRKVLITSVNNGHTDKEPLTKRVINMESLSGEETLTLLRQRAGYKEFRGMEQLAKDFAKRSMGLPAAIAVMAKALSYFCERDSGLQTLESALEHVFEGENHYFIHLLSSALDMLPTSILMDFAWRGSHFFCDSGSVHYNELIAYWIMEGYFGHIDCIEKAYEEGHRVLMELIDCGFLKKVEADCVSMERSKEADSIVMERAMLNLDNCHHFGFDAIASLGLADVFEVGKWQGLGRITQKDGVIRTPCGGQTKKKLLTLLLDGNRLCEEVVNDFCKSNDKLQVLAIFNPTLESLPPAFSAMTDLTMLVLRGCNFLNNIDQIQKLLKLTVLEISGASFIEEMPDMFGSMSELQSLNLSGLQITKLPESFYRLTKLHRLFLTDCPKLKELKALGNCDKLVVLNLSGATALKTFPYGSLEAMHKLRTLDLSGTKIKKIPLFGGIHQLTHISLRDCQFVDRLPHIKSLYCLEVLDISGAKSFVEFQDQSFQPNAALKIIDLSGTKVQKLPSNIGNPRHLYLKDCSKLEKLPYMEALTNLEALYISGACRQEIKGKCSESGGDSLKIDKKFFENLEKLQIVSLLESNIKSLPSLSNLYMLRQLLVSGCSSLKIFPCLNNLERLEVLDLSGCHDLEELQDKSFVKMTCLQRLILSETKIKQLPDLSNLSNLRHLSLSKCTKLEVLPSLGSLSRLEELNLCCVTCLGETETDADFLENMVHLRILDLSETHLKMLPFMSKLKNLNKLFLRGCKQLKAVPDLKELTKLEVLDLSGTAVNDLPSLDHFMNLHQLLLRDCPNLRELLHCEMLRRSGATINEGQISDVTHLEPPEEINCEGELTPYQWHISSLPEMLTDREVPFISVSGSKFFQLLDKNHSLWKTSFKMFHFSICPVDHRNSKGGILCYRDELIFRDIYLKARCLAYFNKLERSLEICGFDNPPEGVVNVLSQSHAEYLFLFDNPFIKKLNDLDANNMKRIKGCWIERCKNMESISELGENLEILWISVVLNLNSIHSGKQQHEGFQNLKYLYLDCCPKLLSVFSSSQQPKNLEILQIKFCDELVAVFDQSAECELPRLKTLLLWELPKLKSIGCVMPPSATIIVGECPNLRQ